MKSHVEESAIIVPHTIERDLAHIKEGLSLLGIRPCSRCGRFFRDAVASDTFTYLGETVCYDCLGPWWATRSNQLDIESRGRFEQKLMRWLMDHHDAIVVRDLRELPVSEEFRIVVSCRECSGTGMLGKDRCRHCLGNKNVWAVVPSRHS